MMALHGRKNASIVLRSEVRALRTGDKVPDDDVLDALGCVVHLFGPSQGFACKNSS